MNMILGMKKLNFNKVFTKNNTILDFFKGIQVILIGLIQNFERVIVKYRKVNCFDLIASLQLCEHQVFS